MDSGAADEKAGIGIIHLLGPDIVQQGTVHVHEALLDIAAQFVATRYRFVHGQCTVHMGERVGIAGLLVGSTSTRHGRRAVQGLGHGHPR